MPTAQELKRAWEELDAQIVAAEKEEREAKEARLQAEEEAQVVGGSGTEFQPGKEFGVAGSIMETWKTGWIERMLSGR